MKVAFPVTPTTMCHHEPEKWARENWAIKRELFGRGNAHMSAAKWSNQFSFQSLKASENSPLQFVNWFMIHLCAGLLRPIRISLLLQSHWLATAARDFVARAIDGIAASPCDDVVDERRECFHYEVSSAPLSSSSSHVWKLAQRGNKYWSWSALWLNIESPLCP